MFNSLGLSDDDILPPSSEKKKKKKSKFPRDAVVDHDIYGIVEGHLTVKRGERVVILSEKLDGWGFVQNKNGRKGLLKLSNLTIEMTEKEKAEQQKRIEKIIKPRKQGKKSGSVFSKGGGGGGGGNIYHDIPQNITDGKYFGKRLDTEDVTSIPPFIYHLMEKILSSYIDSVGIFRKNGSKVLIDEVIEFLDDTEEEDLEALDLFEILENDPHSMSGLLKVYLKQLPEPLFTFELYDAFLTIGRSSKLEIHENNEELRELISSSKKIPKTHFHLAQKLSEFIHKISKNSRTNKMTPKYMAMIFETYFLRPRILELSDFQDKEVRVRLLTAIFSNYEYYYLPIHEK